MTVVLLALASAALFGATTVAIRGAMGSADPAVAALATQFPAILIALVAVLATGRVHGVWPFLLAGVLSPGASQTLFVLSVREAGPSRTSVAVGAAPLLAVAIALVFLHEPLRLPLVAGALAVVAGGVALASERDRPAHIRRRGLLYAALAVVFFSVRDNLVRALHGHSTPAAALLATLVGGGLVTAAVARRLPTRAEATRLAPAGILFGTSYLCLFEAYFRGRVTVVSPLVATESLWGVGLSALVLGAREGVGRRVVLGAVLVVAGGAVIGAYR